MAVNDFKILVIGKWQKH